MELRPLYFLYILQENNIAVLNGNSYIVNFYDIHSQYALEIIQLLIGILFVCTMIAQITHNVRVMQREMKYVIAVLNL